MLTYYMSVPNLELALEYTEPDLALAEVAKGQEIVGFIIVSLVDLEKGTIKVETFEEISLSDLTRLEVFFDKELNTSNDS